MKKQIEVSAWGIEMADWFRTLLPAEMNLGDAWRAKWAKCFDDLLRLDKRTHEQIVAVCQWARADDFWGGKGVFNVEQLPSKPFMDEIGKQGLPWHVAELAPGAQADLFAVKT